MLAIYSHPCYLALSFFWGSPFWKTSRSVLLTTVWITYANMLTLAIMLEWWNLFNSWDIWRAQYWFCSDISHICNAELSILYYHLAEYCLWCITLAYLNPDAGKLDYSLYKKPVIAADFLSSILHFLSVDRDCTFSEVWSALAAKILKIEIRNFFSVSFGD